MRNIIKIALSLLMLITMLTIPHDAQAKSLKYTFNEIKTTRWILYRSIERPEDIEVTNSRGENVTFSGKIARVNGNSLSWTSCAKCTTKSHLTSKLTFKVWYSGGTIKKYTKATGL